MRGMIYVMILIILWRVPAPENDQDKSGLSCGF